MSYAGFVKHLLNKEYKNIIALKEEYAKGKSEGNKLGYKEGYKIASDKFRISYNCCSCGGEIAIQPKSDIVKSIKEYLRQNGWQHKVCPKPNEIEDKERSI